MSSRSLLCTAPYRRHVVVTRATFATLARQLTLAYLGERIFAFLRDSVIIIRMVCEQPSKPGGTQFSS